jgi:hypothetical protein
MANRRSIEEKIEKLKQMATLGLAETEQLLGGDRQHKWSIPDRKAACAVKSPVNGAAVRGGRKGGAVGTAEGPSQAEMSGS